MSAEAALETAEGELEAAEATLTEKTEAAEAAATALTAATTTQTEAAEAPPPRSPPDNRGYEPWKRRCSRS